MGDTIVNTARGTNNILSNRIVVDMSNEISLLKPRLYPLTVLTKKLGTKSAHNYKFEWMEDDIMARWANCTAGVASTVTTTIPLDSGNGSLVAANDLLKVVATSEVLKVVSVAGDNVTVVRGYGETAAANIPANAKILVMAPAMMQGGSAPAEKYNQPTAVYNYTQIFKTAFSATNTLEAINLYGDKELARLQGKKAVEHAMSIEYALLFGERKLDTSGAQPTTTTAGVFKFLAGTPNVKQITKVTGVQKDLDAVMETIFTYGSDTKVALCSPSFITWVNQLAQGKVQLIQADKDKTFGLDINSYQTPHGRLNMVMHPLLTQGYADYAVVLDMDNLSYRPLEGRDTKLKTNVQLPDEDGRRDMYITEAGLELRMPKTHGLIQLV